MNRPYFGGMPPKSIGNDWSGQPSKPNDLFGMRLILPGDSGNSSGGFVGHPGNFGGNSGGFYPITPLTIHRPPIAIPIAKNINSVDPGAIANSGSIAGFARKPSLEETRNIRKQIIKKLRTVMKLLLAKRFRDKLTFQADQETEFWKLKGFRTLTDFKLYAICGTMPLGYIPSCLQELDREFPTNATKSDPSIYCASRLTVNSRSHQVVFSKQLGFKKQEDLQLYLYRDILPSGYIPDFLNPPAPQTSQVAPNCDQNTSALLPVTEKKLPVTPNPPPARFVPASSSSRTNVRVVNSVPVSSLHASAKPSSLTTVLSSSKALNKDNSKWSARDKRKAVVNTKIRQDIDATVTKHQKTIESYPPSSSHVNMPASDPMKYCSLCEIRFSSSLREHRQSPRHKSTKALLNPVCAECNRSFDSAASYRKHYSDIHKKAATISLDLSVSEKQDDRVGEAFKDGDGDVKDSYSDVDLDEQFFLEQSAVGSPLDGGGDFDCDSDSVCEIINDEEVPDSADFVDTVAETTESTIKPVRHVKPTMRTHLEKQVAKELPDFVVRARFCNLCSVFFHDDKSLIHIHCKSRKHLASVIKCSET